MKMTLYGVLKVFIIELFLPAPMNVTPNNLYKVVSN